MNLFTLKTTIYTLIFLIFSASSLTVSFGQEVQKVDKNITEKTNQKNTAELSDSESDMPGKEEKPVRRRIVDPKTIKERRSPIGNFLLKPFRAIAPAVTNRVTRFEENREYQIIFGQPNLPISPQFGSITPGSGIGVGFVASTKDYLSKDFRITGSSIASLKGYVKTTAGVEITPQKFAEKKLKVELIGTQLIFPEEDFFGSGANSNLDDETSYFRRQIGAKLSFSFQATKKIKVGAFTEITRNDITEGSDSNEDTITSRFNSRTLPGLNRNIRLLETGVFAELENRDEPESPHSGWFTRVSFSNSDGLGRSDFGWQGYQFDTRTYIPLGSKRRVVALRLLGDFKSAKGNSAIPFYRLARLGDSETLRGYDTFRFQGRNALHLNVEYRFKLMQGFETSGFRGVEGIFFGDFGQVYNRKEELGWRNLRATWGGGFQLTSTKSVVMAILYAQSPESGRLIFRFGKTF